jgi:hypothetical protein
MKVFANNILELREIYDTVKSIMRFIGRSNLPDYEKSVLHAFLSRIEHVTDITHPPSRGVEHIERERLRQIVLEGFSYGYDLEKNNKEQLGNAAACYALSTETRSNLLSLGTGRLLWPWGAKLFKPCPKNRIHELEKAGALCAAEIDRLLAIKAKEANHAV